MPGSRLTLRRALPADAETIARTVSLGMDTWRAFAPAGWTARPHAQGVAYTRAALSAPSARAVLAFLDGEPAGHFAMTAGEWDEPHAAELDSLVEVHYGMPWVSYGRSLLPPAAATRENRVVHAGVGSRP